MHERIIVEGYIKMMKPYIDKLKTAEFRISKI